MKKILFALVAITLVFVSCKKENKEGGDTTGCTFTITVSDITSHEAAVSIIPSVKDVPFCATIYEAAEIEGQTDADITTAYYEYMDQVIEFYGNYGMTVYYANMAFVGDQPELSIADLDGGTTYTVVAFQMDSVNKTNYPVSKQNFTTEEADPDEAYSYEPTTATTFTFAPTEINGTYYDSESCFALNIADESNTFVLCTGANYTEAGEKEGTFPVNMDNTVAGAAWGSAGYDGQYIYRTFLGEYTEDGYISAENGIYYVTAGTMTISETGLTANFTTKYGSTVTVNYTGTITWADGEASAPAKIRMAPKGPRMIVRK